VRCQATIYAIVTGTGPIGLTNNVSKYINSGYGVFGSPFLLTNEIYNSIDLYPYGVAMIKN